MFSGGRAGRRARGAVGRRGWAAATPELGEGSGVGADLAGPDRRRENPGSDMEPREEVAKRGPGGFCRFPRGAAQAR